MASLENSRTDRRRANHLAFRHDEGVPTHRLLCVPASSPLTTLSELLILWLSGMTGRDGERCGRQAGAECLGWPVASAEVS
jgi:hypothetical protein